MPFTASDLLLPQSELSQITGALANSGEADPIARVLAECEQTVADYTARYQLTDARRLRLVRGLAPAELYRLAGSTVPPQHQSAKDAAMRELQDIRDGKFPDLAPASVAPATPLHSGAWGSAARIATRDRD